MNPLKKLCKLNLQFTWILEIAQTFLLYYWECSICATLTWDSATVIPWGNIPSGYALVSDLTNLLTEDHLFQTPSVYNLFANIYSCYAKFSFDSQ